MAWRKLLISTARILAVIALILVVVLIALRSAASNAPGRWLASRFVSERSIGEDRTLRVRGIRGDLLGRFRVEEITLSDADGVWLRIEDVEVDWTPRSAVRRPIRIHELTAGQVEVLRRPLPGESNGGGGLPDLPAIELDAARIDELVLEEGVIGPAARLTAEGAARIGGPGIASGRLDVTRTDAPGDRVSTEFRLAPDGVTGTLEARGAPDGPLAALLRLEGQEITADAGMSGDMDRGDGTFEMRAGGSVVATGELGWTPEDWQVGAVLDARPWGLVPDRFTGFAEAARLDVSGRREPDFALERADLVSAGAIVRVEPRGAQVYAIEARLDAPVLSQLTDGAVSAETFTWTGEVDRRDGLAVRGDLDATGVEAAEARIDRVAGPVTVEQDETGYRVITDLDLSGADTGVEALEDAVSEAAALTADVHWSGEARTLTLNDVQLRTDEAHLSATGRYPLDGSEMGLDAALRLADAALLHPALSGPLTVTATSSSVDEAVIELDGTGLRWDADLRPTLANLTATARLRRTGTGWAVPRAQARAAGLRLNAEAALGDGRWRTEGDLALSGRLPVAALDVDGALVTAFRVQSGPDGLTARTVTTSQAIEAGPVAIASPRLAIEARRTDAGTTADWMFSGDGGETRPIALNGRARIDGGAWGLDIDEGQVGQASVTGAVSRADGQLTARLVAAEPDRADVEITYSAPVDALREGELEAHLAFRNVAQGGANLDVAELTLSGPLDDMALSARAAGRLRSRFDLLGEGRLAVTDEGVDLSLLPSGKWSVHPWSAPEPLRLHVGPDGMTTAASIRLGDGRADLLYNTTGEVPHAQLHMSNLPIGMMADIANVPAGAGQVDGYADLRVRDGVWRGRAHVEASELASPAVEDMPTLTLVADLELQDDARLDARLTGGGLDARASMVRYGTTTDLGAIAGTDESRIDGEVRADGSLVALAALYSDGLFTLNSGDIDAGMTVTGTRGNPVVDGRFAVSDGDFLYPAYASRITDITMAGRFTNEGLRLDRLSANDGGNGSLDGSGQLRLTEDGPRGEADVAFDNFHAARNADMTIEASGDARFVLGEDGLDITGLANIDELRAQPTISTGPSVPTIEVTEVNLPKDRRAYSDSRLPIRLNYRVQASENVFISADNFSTEWGLDLTVRGPTSNPGLYGRATLINGSAFVFNRRFRLGDSYVRFDGPPQNARINIVAIYRRVGFEATATATGSINSPEIELSSDPSLPEDEILARLLFDRSVSELGAFEAAQLASQLSGDNLLNVVGQLRDLAGIDRLAIDTGANGEIEITGGRRIGDDVYVEVGTSATSALARVLVEWQLTPSLSLLSVVSADTDATVSVQWGRDY